MKTNKLFIIAAIGFLFVICFSGSAHAQLQEIIDGYCTEVSQEATRAIGELAESTAELVECLSEYYDCMDGVSLFFAKPDRCFTAYRQCLSRESKNYLKECKVFLKKAAANTKHALKQAASEGVEDEFLDWFYSPSSETCLSSVNTIASKCSEVHPVR